MSRRARQTNLNPDLSPFQSQGVGMKCYVSQNVSTSDSPMGDLKAAHQKTPMMVKPNHFQNKKELQLNCTQLSLTLKGRERKFKGIQKGHTNERTQKFKGLGSVNQNNFEFACHSVESTPLKRNCSNSSIKSQNDIFITTMNPKSKLSHSFALKNKESDTGFLRREDNKEDRKSQSAIKSSLSMLREKAKQ
ncbi:unnamed protein product [Moneuplotes crassus]|uniref:Uncharacterized protein n=1 Tax=Euplotes crassus TaxID=5936 RepID=A0AAD1X9K2_EUPCR|nr:unnamed protein product [Moneuplotes crassus]